MGECTLAAHSAGMACCEDGEGVLAPVDVGRRQPGVRTSASDYSWFMHAYTYSSPGHGFHIKIALAVAFLE